MTNYKLAPLMNKVTFINTERYWKICIITNSFDKKSYSNRCYKKRQLDSAKKFLEEEFPQLATQTNLSKEENQYLQNNLWKMFHNQTLDMKQRSLAGICLRCYVSYSIVKGCEILANRAGEKIDLDIVLSHVLNDDGSTPVVVSGDRKTQFIVKRNGETQTIPKVGIIVGVEVLSSYNPNLSESKNSESLDNWCIRRVKQNKDLQILLLEYGVWVPSDWSLLCREIPQSLSVYLRDGDRSLIKVFHKVYRRDRRKSQQRGRCSEPTPSQLDEMLLLLREKGIILHSGLELIQKFQEIAEILRQDNHSIKTGKPKTDSIDTNSSSEDNSNSFSKLSQIGTNNNDCEDIEEKELRLILNKLPSTTLYHAISFRVPQRIEQLASKKTSSAYADKFLPGLGLYYHELNPVSLKYIAEQWQTNWAKVRRIFQLSEFIENVQYTSEEIFISKIQEEAGHFFASEISCKPNNLKEIVEEARKFLNEIAFKEAYAEILASKNPYKNSLFAQQLRIYVRAKTN